MRLASAVMLACLALLAGCGAPSLLITPVSNKTDLVETEVEPGKGLLPAKIAIIPIEGLIMNARGAGLLQPAENPVSLLTQQLKRAEEDDAIKAVVLRINSPGGTVTASDTIYTLIREFREHTHKPVIASIQEVAASGGYYIACASDHIVAQPTSVVGSIGVIFTTFDVVGTMDKIGARSYTIKSGQFKDMGSPFKPLTEAERQVIQNMIDEYFVRFRAVVQTNRQLAQDQAGVVTDGRVFTGEQALTLKLVDRLGTLEGALDLAREKADAPGAKAVLYMRPYGYGGSIYAQNQLPSPEAKSTTLSLPGFHDLLPTGFYYLWHP